MEKFMSPEYLDKFQTYCLMKDGTIVESFDDLLTRRIELEPYISSFIEETQQQPTVQWTKGKNYSLPYTERGAILISMKNSLYNRRKSYVDTFCSSIFYTEERCAEILQDIETNARFTGNTSILGSNPLIGLLGLNELTNVSWTSLIITSVTKHYQYVPGEFTEWAFADKRLDINMYHPYVWYLLEKKNYFKFKEFTRDGTYIKHLK